MVVMRRRLPRVPLVHKAAKVTRLPPQGSQPEAVPQVVPHVWEHGGERWCVETTVDPRSGRCVAVKVSPFDSPTDAGVTEALLASLPVAEMTGAHLRWIETRPNFERNFFLGMILDVLLRCGVVKKVRRPDGTEAWELAGDDEPLKRWMPTLAKAPAGYPAGSTERFGRPPVAHEFLEEVAGAYLVAGQIGLPRYRTVSRYLSLRLDKPPSEDQVDEYIKRCRTERLLPPSGWTKPPAGDGPG